MLVGMIFKARTMPDIVPHVYCFPYLRNKKSFFGDSLLSFVLKNLNHILVATNELAASVQHSGVRETAFLHDLSRCGIAGEMICPDVFEMLHLDAVVNHQFQCFGADSSVPIRLSYPVANLTVVFSDRDIAGFLGVVAHAADSLTSLFQDNCPCRVIMEECPDDFPTFLY